MSITPCPVVRFNAQLMAEDAAELGLSKDALARRAKVSDMTVIRFLRGEFQTPMTAKKLATALRQPVSRYLIRSEANHGNA